MQFIYGIVNLKENTILSLSDWNSVLSLKKEFNICQKIKSELFDEWKISMKDKLSQLNPIEVPVLYFDAGTAFKSLESRVTDHNGVNLIDFESIKDLEFLGSINSRQNFELNNQSFGINHAEMIGCIIAIKIALKHNIMKILGDSKCTIFYWLNEFFIKHKKKFNVDKEIHLIGINLIKQYCELGGKICYINRKENKADLRYKKIC